MPYCGIVVIGAARLTETVSAASAERQNSRAIAMADGLIQHVALRGRIRMDDRASSRPTQICERQSRSGIRENSDASRATTEFSRIPLPRPSPLTGAFIVPAVGRIHSSGSARAPPLYRRRLAWGS